MSGSFGTDTVEGFEGFTTLSLTNSRLVSDLVDLLLAEAIVPGSPPSYQLCKKIWTSHPLGGKIVEKPVELAQSQERDITIPGGPEARLLAEFKKTWNDLGGKSISADTIIHDLHCAKRAYGIASVVYGDKKQRPSEPVKLDLLADADLYFNVLDPLNTAGSLVLDQNPNSPDFQKTHSIAVAGVSYHPSRSLVVMNEQPIYIEWTTGAFGFVGRPVFQRILFPLKSYITGLLTFDYVLQKVGLLVAKRKSPGSIVSERMKNLFKIAAQRIKTGVLGNVLTIGTEESIESLNFQNLQGAGEFAFSNVLRAIESGAGMPAKMLEQEVLAKGLAEGTEDAKQIAKYIANERKTMAPTYAHFDMICQRKAWSPTFYESIKADFSQYQDIPYETAFYQWSNSFKAEWPNLLEEPDSEKMKGEEIRFKSAVALFQVLVPVLDPVNKATAVGWLADEINSRRDLFSNPLLIDEELIAEHAETQAAQMATAGLETKEKEPPAFSSRT